MAKKQHAEEHENLERWMVSYADFMTLLFATFVVLYALSQIDLAKFKELKVSIRKAFSAPTIIDNQSGGGKTSDDPSVLDSSGNSILDEGADSDAPITPIMAAIEKQSEKDNFNDIKKELDKMGKDSGINADVTDRGLVINFDNKILFDQGSARINKSVEPKLYKIGEMLKERLPDHTIRVEGHTDALPISSVIYPSNWELSSARSSSVVRFFITHFKFDKNVFAAVGYADSKPVANNNTEVGRRKNRRVEIVILKNQYLPSEPAIKGLNKLRAEKIKEYQAKKHLKIEKIPAKNTQNSGVSDAAAKLMQDTGADKASVVIYKDAYDIESDRLGKQLDEMSQKAIKDSKINK